MANLTDKQKQFCKEYVLDFNATQAAIRAGYSEKGADVQGNRLLSNVRIEAYISKLKAKRQDKYEITEERILREYARMAFSNVSDFYDDWGKLKPFEDLTEDQKAALSAIKHKVNTGEGWENTETDIKTHNKVAALDALAKHIGLYEKDNEQKKGIFTLKVE